MIFAVSVSTGLDIWEREYGIVFVEAEDRSDAVGSVNDANRDQFERGHFRVHDAMAMPEPPQPRLVMLTLGRSEAMFEDRHGDAIPHGLWPIPPEIPGSVVELGPFEYVEFTYQLLRVGPDAEHVIGYFADGLWWLNNDRYPFSDLDIYAQKKAQS